MILKKTHLVLAAAVLAAASVSCNKDNSETLPTLDGNLYLRGVPTYVKAGDETVFHIEPYGVTHPDGYGIGYRWRLTPPSGSEYTTSKEENGDGDGAFDINIHENSGDTLRTLTLTCEAFADGYSGKSTSYSIVVVASGENGSIQHAGYDFTGSKVSHDGIDYLVYTAPDGKTWMKQNLAYDGEDPDNKVGAPFQDSEAMSDVFGRFYTWEEALGIEPGETPAGGNVQGICPDGWHIPSDEEWTALANATMVYAGYDGWTPIDSSANWAADGYKVSREFMAGEILRDDIQESDDDYDSDIEYGKEARSATFNTDTELWQYVNAVGDPTNRSGISAIPVGYARRTNGMWSFYGNYEYAIFWTSSYDPESGKAICRVINNESPDVYMESHDRSSFAASVRCVKD